MFWESVLDDVPVEALFLGLCWATETVDVILLEALLLGLCSRSQNLMVLVWVGGLEGNMIVVWL